jgi:ankyrin repeat protein
MPPPELPLELLLMIAHHIRDDQGELRYGDFNSFLQVNRALHACLNRMLWKEAAEHGTSVQRVFTHLIDTNDLAGLDFFLVLGADVEVHLPDFEITCCEDDEEFGAAAQLGPTLLLIAADSDNVPLTRLLLEKGAKVQYIDRHGRGYFSPMHAARSAEMVQLLLDHGADPNLNDEDESRPLHWYAIRDDIAAMRAILQHGAEVNPVRRPTLETPLHDAAQSNLDAVELLVEYGTDVEARDSLGSTALHLAARVEMIDVVKFLVEQWPEGIRTTNERHVTPLHSAVMLGTSEVVKFLVEQWPDGVRERDICLNTPLHLAASTATIEVVRFLVERWPEGKGALNNKGKTPLSMLEKSGRRLSDEEREEIFALLGSPYSEVNND